MKIDFTDNFLQEFEKLHKGFQINRFHNKEKSLILNYPFENINIEIKPKNTGVFVIQLINFKFLNISYWKIIGKKN